MLDADNVTVHIVSAENCFGYDVRPERYPVHRVTMRPAGLEISFFGEQK